MNLGSANFWYHFSGDGLGELLDRDCLYQRPHVDLESVTTFTIVPLFVKRKPDDDTTGQGYRDRVDIEVPSTTFISKS